MGIKATAHLRCTKNIYTTFRKKKYVNFSGYFLMLFMFHLKVLGYLTSLQFSFIISKMRIIANVRYQMMMTE